MKEEKILFKENDLIYSNKIKGIHRVVRVYKDEEKDAQLITELLYDEKYNKVLLPYRDREYTINSYHCKLVDLDKLLSFEEKKFEKMQNVIQILKSIKKKNNV